MKNYVPVIPAESIVPGTDGIFPVLGSFLRGPVHWCQRLPGAEDRTGIRGGHSHHNFGHGFEQRLNRKNALQENVIIQSIGSASGVIVAGAIFTVPGLYILGLEDQAGFFRIFMASLLGGLLGILFLVPFRRYFVKDMHGEFPFPEATASTEVLMAGEKGGGAASTLLKAAALGGIYNFLSGTFGFWRELFTTRVFVWGQNLAAGTRLEFRLLTTRR